MAARETVTLAYTGPALQNGEMDVRDLAPALLAAAGLVEASARVLYGSQFNVSVQVSATREGSFELDLAIVATSMFEVVRDILTGDNLAAIQNLRDLLFGGGSLLGFLAWLKNRKGKATPLEKGMVRIEVHGDVIIMPTGVLDLAKDARVRRAAEAMTRPLDKAGIEGFEVRDGSRTIVSVGEADRPAFQPPEEVDQLVNESSQRMVLTVVSLAFKADNKWRMSDGQSTFHATIEDAEFMRRVNENVEQFAKDDYLICEVAVRQYQTKTGLKSEYTVKQVIEHKSAFRQLDLGIEVATDTPSSSDGEEA